MIAFGAPQLLLSLWGGVIADRLPKRKVLWVTESIIAANSLWLASMIAFGMVEFWMLIVAGISRRGFAFVVQRARPISPNLCKESLGNAVVLQQLSMEQYPRHRPDDQGVMIGIPFIGIGGVYFVTSLGFVVAMLGLILRQAIRDREPWPALLSVTWSTG